MPIDWSKTLYGRPEGPNIDYDDNGLAYKTQGGVRAPMAVLSNQLPNTPVAIGGRNGRNDPLPPAWAGQEVAQQVYDPFTPNPLGGSETSSPEGSQFEQKERNYFGHTDAPQSYYDPFFVPGRDSPWGQQDQPGSNRDFYRQQFNNLLAEQQSFQQQELAAAMRREAANNAPTPTPQIVSK